MAIKTSSRLNRALLIVLGVIILLIITLLDVPIIAGSFEVAWK